MCSYRTYSRSMNTGVILSEAKNLRLRPFAALRVTIIQFMESEAKNLRSKESAGRVWAKTLRSAQG
jgi:hypothetical protein